MKDCFGKYPIDLVNKAQNKEILFVILNKIIFKKFLFSFLIKRNIKMIKRNFS